MKIAVIGAGNICGTLGEKWAAAGHALAFGVRSPSDEKYAALRRLAAVLPVAEALAFGEVVLLAQPGTAVPEFAARYGPALAGKLVIDATNNRAQKDLNSLEVLAERAPGARLGRAFSTLGWENFAQPQLGGAPVDLFFCAAPADQALLEKLIADTGLHPVYVGGLDQVPALDGLTRLWFALVFGQKRGRRLAFKLVAED